MSPNCMRISCRFFFFEHGICFLFVRKSAVGIEPKGSHDLCVSAICKFPLPSPSNNFKGTLKSAVGPQNKICTSWCGFSAALCEEDSADLTPVDVPYRVIV